MNKPIRRTAYIKIIRRQPECLNVGYMYYKLIRIAKKPVKEIMTKRQYGS